MGDFQEDNFEQKLLGLKDTQDSIQSLSIWCLKHQQCHKKVVGCWLHVLKKVKVDQRVTLFYLANDVIQYSKRKNFPFVESWATALQKATPLVRDDRVKHKILRLFKIWDERNVYDETFLADLSGLLTAHTKKSNQVSTAELIQEFQPSLLFTKIRKCKVLEEDTDLKLKFVKESNIPVSDPDALQIAVKDRRNGDDLIQDIDDGIIKLEAYTKALELEIKERTDVIDVLEVSEQFYETQRGEAKVVFNAYRNFGNRIKILKRKLDELLPTLPSPVPSPDINAPSPSSESDNDLEVPTEDKNVSYDSEKSFIGTDFVTAMNSMNEKQVEFMRNMHVRYDPQEVETTTPYNIHALPPNYEYQPAREINEYYKNNFAHDFESPASPAGKHNLSDPYSYASEGNPIEVISSTNNDNHGFSSVGQFLQNLLTNNSTADSVPPNRSKIPGLESPTSNSQEVFSFIESKVKPEDAPLTWNDKPLTKYQSWPSPDISWNNPQETPVSPPAFEQESYSHPVEYIDTNVDNTRFPVPFSNTDSPVDIDHRILNSKPRGAANHEFEGQVAAIPLPKHDIDDRVLLQNNIANRNLISLTESPSVNDSWKLNDSDYRAIPMPPTPPLPLKSMDVGRVSKPPQDNIESVDMEMSDDESEANDKNVNSKHRKSSFKEEDDLHKKIDHQPSQLLPPPNPWDIVNISHLDNMDESDGNSKPAGNDANFNEMMSNFMANSNIPPMPDFPPFPMPPNTNDVKPFSSIPFTPPPMMRMPLRDPAMFHSRPDFPPPRHSLPNNFPPFHFMPFSEPNARGPSIFSNTVPNNVNQTPRKDGYTSGSYSDEGRSVDSYGSSENHQFAERYKSKNVNTIEPLIHNRQFDKRLPDNVATFEGVSDYLQKNNKPVRSNLKEISLSNALEKSISEKDSMHDDTNDDEDNEQSYNRSSTETYENKNEDNEMESPNINNDDLFGDDSNNNDNTNDDGDDLYNNIEETTDNAEDAGNSKTNEKPNSQFNYHAEDKTSGSKMLCSDVKFEQKNNFVVYESEDDLQNNTLSAGDENKNNFGSSEFRQKPKTPFQATVPKVARSAMAPPNLMEDEERHQWPLLPVIDLSNEVSSMGGYSSAKQNSDEEPFNNFSSFNGSPIDCRPPMFNLRGGMNKEMQPRLFMNNSPRERRFPNPAHLSSPRLRGDMSNRPRRFLMSPRQDYRPRGSPDQIRRMNRSPFQRSSGSVNRRNFQNSPRMFKGGPARPFRRGW